MKAIPLTYRALPLVAMGVVLISPPLAGAAGSDQRSADSMFAAADRPLPFGVGVNYLYQEEDYRVANLSVGIPTPPIPLPPIGSGLIQNVTSSVNETNAKIDWWALPMLNVHALFGSVVGNANASAQPFGDFNVDFSGINYGGGLTLAGGWNNWFATVTADYLWADINFKSSPGLALADQHGIGTFVLLPKFGYRFDSVAVWVGAQYQRTRHTQPGSFTTSMFGPTVTIPFSAEVEDQEHWGFIAGAQWSITDNWVLMTEGGVGAHRKQVLVGMTYRF